MIISFLITISGLYDMFPFSTHFTEECRLTRKHITWYCTHSADDIMHNVIGENSELIHNSTITCTFHVEIPAAVSTMLLSQDYRVRVCCK